MNGEKIAYSNGGRVRYTCPGCDIDHTLNVDTPDGPRWFWNRSMVSPTFSPSILVQYEQNGMPKVCHSYVKEGKIQYLDDCTHHFKGKTVDMPDWED